jgi:hypothetical protein
LMFLQHVSFVRQIVLHLYRQTAKTHRPSGRYTMAGRRIHPCSLYVDSPVAVGRNHLFQIIVMFRWQRCSSSTNRESSSLVSAWAFVCCIIVNHGGDDHL